MESFRASFRAAVSDVPSCFSCQPGLYFSLEMIHNGILQITEIIRAFLVLYRVWNCGKVASVMSAKIEISLDFDWFLGNAVKLFQKYHIVISVW